MRDDFQRGVTLTTALLVAEGAPHF